MGSRNLVMKKAVKPSSFDLDVQLDQSWKEDVTCPICLDCPHNAVLLRCTSYEKGCRPFICDTDQTRSNCLERFKGAHGLPANVKVSSLTLAPINSIHIISSNANNRPACPLCRGDVIGWFVIDEARFHLNEKKRCCEENGCSYVGNFHDLQKHTQQKHPNSRPSEIDPARQIDWENLQQSSDIIDVLSTIRAHVPNGLGGTGGHPVFSASHFVDLQVAKEGQEQEKIELVAGGAAIHLFMKAFLLKRPQDLLTSENSDSMK